MVGPGGTRPRSASERLVALVAAGRRPQRPGPCSWSSSSGRGSTEPYHTKGQPAVLVGHPGCNGITFGLSIWPSVSAPCSTRSGSSPRRSRSRTVTTVGPPNWSPQGPAATLVNAFEGSTIKRRKLIWTSAGIGLGAFGGFGDRLRRRPDQEPWKPVVPTANGMKPCSGPPTGPPVQGRDRSTSVARHRPPRRVGVHQDPPEHRRRRHGDSVPVAGVRTATAPASSRP